MWVEPAGNSKLQQQQEKQTIPLLAGILCSFVTIGGVKVHALICYFSAAHQQYFESTSRSPFLKKNSFLLFLFQILHFPQALISLLHLSHPAEVPWVIPYEENGRKRKEKSILFLFTEPLCNNILTSPSEFIIIFSHYFLSHVSEEHCLCVLRGANLLSFCLPPQGPPNILISIVNPYTPSNTRTLL